MIGNIFINYLNFYNCNKIFVNIINLTNICHLVKNLGDVKGDIFLTHVSPHLSMFFLFSFVIYLGCVPMFFGKPVRSHERHYYMRKKTSQQTVFLLPIIPIYTKYVLSLVQIFISLYLFMFPMFVCFSNPILWENYIIFCIPYDFVQVQLSKHTIL